MSFIKELETSPVSQKHQTPMKPLDTDDVWKRFSQDLRIFVNNRLKDKDISEDIIQIIFLKIHLNLHQLKDLSKLRSWLFQIAKNAVMDYYRKLNKERKFKEELYTLRNNGPEENHVKEILYFCMDHFIGLLPQIYKDALLYTEIDGNTQAKLAQKEGVSLSGAKYRVQKARKLLKEKILEYSGREVEKEGFDMELLLEKCPFS